MQHGVEKYRKTRTGRTYRKNPPFTRVTNKEGAATLVNAFIVMASPEPKKEKPAIERKKPRKRGKEKHG